MSNNVILPGTGAGVSTDEVGANVHVQHMKIMSSVEDSTEPLTKEENTLHTSGVNGILSMGVRLDEPTPLASGENKYLPPSYDGKGRLYVSTPDSQLLTRQYDISTTVIYVGTAPRGTATSAVGWTIKKTTLTPPDNPTSETWTDEGVAIWNNRTTESYS